MKFLDIRDRVLLAALLPVTVVAFLLSAVFLLGRVGDLDDAHEQRARSLARQVASASEYGVFAGNFGHLQTIAAGALREADVRSVLIQDVQGNVLARAGKVGYKSLPLLGDDESQWNDETTRHDLLVQPVTTAQLRLDDPFEPNAQPRGNAPQVLGHVVIEMSRQTVV